MTTEIQKPSMSLLSKQQVADLFTGKENTRWSKGIAPKERWHAINTAFRLVEEDALNRIEALKVEEGADTHTTLPLEPARENLDEIILALKKSYPSYPLAVHPHFEKESHLFRLKGEIEKDGASLVDYAVYLGTGTNSAMQLYDCLAAAPIGFDLHKLLTEALMERSKMNVNHFFQSYRVYCEVEDATKHMPGVMRFSGFEEQHCHYTERPLWPMAASSLNQTQKELLLHCAHSFEDDRHFKTLIPGHLENVIWNQTPFGKLHSLRDLVLGNRPFDSKYCQQDGKPERVYYHDASELMRARIPLSKRMTDAQELFGQIEAKLAQFAAAAGIVQDQGLAVAIYYRLRNQDGKLSSIPFQLAETL